MKKTVHYKGHRWTTNELKELMQLWASGYSPKAIAKKLNATTAAILKMIVRLRAQGIPLARRTRGHKSGRHNKPWTQGEVEYVIRRRNESATVDQIGHELGRSWCSINAMIGILRKEGVPVAMMGQGVRRLWSPTDLKAMATQQPELKVIELETKAAS